MTQTIYLIFVLINPQIGPTPEWSENTPIQWTQTPIVLELKGSMGYCKAMIDAMAISIRLNDNAQFKAMCIAQEE